ncbi:MAG: UbiD family decarboxylase [Alphaproteobacteria bacterium]|jgi:4-hydroxy-3-polyprenylbenzoate decarboxylase|nr:UbiD family decarboxylase [Alphaproteobacteria bacterium]MDP6567281.1 UbiD family decarboxylase [Alphaproteobacteria bacterium]MDP6811711.1 UbiD family decarboxylase [Alphaproteobacteria bacterium]
MAHKDLREFTEALAASRDLVTIDDEVDWDQELAGIGRLSCERDGPAFMFNNVKDYAGWRVLANPVTGWRRYAVALGLPADTPIRELYRIYAEREQNPIPPILVNDSACKEVIIPRDEIDLFDLPVPMVHDGDGGRYLGTWDLVVSKDRDSGWVNWGMYRFMIHDERHMTGYPRPTSHLGKMLLDGYAPKGEVMPIAIAIGTDQPSHLSSTATFRIGGDEVELAGGLGESPVELIKCETSDLYVPASAEIVVEAEIYPDKIAQEGPYGEYPGYRSGEMGNSVCARVTAITHRRDPIFTIDTTGFMDSSAVTTSISGAIAIRRRLERHGVPVSEVYIPPESGVHMAIVSVSRGGPEVARQVVEVLTARRALMSKIIVVDDDVDVFNQSAVIHAFSTKCHPDRGTHIHRYEGRANALTPAYSQEERLGKLGASVAFDATWPPDWPAETTPVRATLDSMYSQDVQDRVNARWRKLGL